MVEGFDWDPAKAAVNRRKHRVTFAEAATVFADSLARVVPDPARPQGEVRWRILGRSAQDRLLVVVFVDRDDTIRIVSARVAEPRERRAYESLAGT